MDRQVYVLVCYWPVEGRSVPEKEEYGPFESFEEALEYAEKLGCPSYNIAKAYIIEVG